ARLTLLLAVQSVVVVSPGYELSASTLFFDFFYFSFALLSLLSFPTRRSSDLRCSNLPDEAGSVVDTSAIPVAATIEQRAEEGTGQVVVPEVKFDGVDTGLHRYLCGVGELFHHSGDLTSSDRTAVLERRGVDHPARRHGSGAGDLLGRDRPGMTQLGAHH